jgi:hypothetical protein
VGVHTRTQWVASFHKAARGLLARHPGYSDYRALIHAGLCPQHGPPCVRVVFGILLRHVAWPESDPGEVAEEVVRNMLPPSASDPDHAGATATASPAGAVTLGRGGLPAAG